MRLYFKIIGFIALMAVGGKTSVCQAQSASSKKGTAYIFFLYGTMESGWPIASEIICTDIKNLAGLSDVPERSVFLCSLFKRTVQFEEPNFTLEKNINLYNFTNEKEKRQFLSKAMLQIGKMNGGLKKLGIKRFLKGSSIQVDAIKVYGDFWHIAASTTEDLNKYSHSFNVEPDCYNKGFIYNIKSIESVWKLSPREMLQIKNAIGLQ